jgi:hypothetical protein
MTRGEGWREDDSDICPSSPSCSLSLFTAIKLHHQDGDICDHILGCSIHSFFAGILQTSEDVEAWQAFHIMSFCKLHCRKGCLYSTSSLSVHCVVFLCCRLVLNTDACMLSDTPENEAGEVTLTQQQGADKRAHFCFQ